MIKTLIAIMLCISGAAYADCYRSSCEVFTVIQRNENELYLYVSGQLTNVWELSPAVGAKKPMFDKHPTGRVFGETGGRISTDGKGLIFDGLVLVGMPYSVFIDDLWSIHSTPDNLWTNPHPRGGQKYGFGLREEQVKILIDQIERAGPKQSWITVR